MLLVFFRNANPEVARCHWDCREDSLGIYAVGHNYVLSRLLALRPFLQAAMDNS